MRPIVVHWLDTFLPGGFAAALAPTWFTCVGLAGVVTLFVMRAIARRRRIEPGVVAGIVLWCYVAAVAAGIVVPAAIDAAEQMLTTGHAHLRWAGMTSFWGYLAGGCAVAMVCRAHGVPLRRFADLTAAPLGLALMLARLGCFLAGCDYGKVSSLPWAMRFPAYSPAWHDHVSAGLVPADRIESLPVHPTQLYEAALGLAIAAVALLVARSRWARRSDGRVFLLAAAMYAIGRLAVEDVRGDTGRGIYVGLSSGQIFSWLLLAAIAAGLWLRRARPAVAITAAAAAIGIALVAITAPSFAHADSTSAQPGGPAPAPPPPSPAPPPVDPYAPPGAPPAAWPPPAPAAAPMAAPTPLPPPAASTEASGGSTILVGALVGYAAPFNRRRDQVPPLGGGSVSIGLAFSHLGVWLDLDSLGNRDASHGTVLLSGSLIMPVSDKLWIGGRIGFGATLVNFDDPAFRDVAGTTVRFEAVADYRIGQSWALWIRPLSFDVLTAADLGGPIATWQARIGLAYHFSVGRRAAASPTVASTTSPAIVPTASPPVATTAAAPTPAPARRVP